MRGVHNRLSFSSFVFVRGRPSMASFLPSRRHATIPAFHHLSASCLHPTHARRRPSLTHSNLIFQRASSIFPSRLAVVAEPLMPSFRPLH
ncbi:hypothetical protein E2C01_077404 [Portunus trituberculatus]|uniref:Uncharacterized protein n=1 Tax=Portunus trituberculatus TaxID=210409 RepID=A0A5B7IFZ9_PORTR|nr:hypothetical protein [Portunus trituberculatus]